ncbi:ABC transporter ATP-binding protein [Haloferax prahovense]|uniref:ABC transporter ATP-binding protein n=1 Tax=Haloferax TaxID=2251 RepID=UPI000737B208|nr:ABC transporter ATP-binding protein [Haloferax sp. Q22]
MSDDPLLRVDDLSVHFGGNEGILDRFLGDDKGVVRAVDNVSLDIGENDVVALVGESGCGKTTLGKAMIGLQRPTSGTVRFRGQDIWKSNLEPGDIPYKEIRKSLQMVHQDAGNSLDPNRTIFKNLNPALKKWRPELNLVERRELVHQMLDTVGLTPADDYASRYPHQLSGGEAQRTVIVRSMLLEPDLILADEAVSALDVSLRVNLMDLLLELQEMFSTSFVFISHNMANARYLAGRADGRIAVMYLGRIVEIGPADEIIKNPQHPYTKSLLWATSGLSEINDPIETPPVRKIDIPDPENPPSGCRFHTRCPEAREYCTSNTPDLSGMSGPSDRHEAACFDAHDRIDYRNSEPLTDDLDIGVADDAEQPAD